MSALHASKGPKMETPAFEIPIERRVDSDGVVVLTLGDFGAWIGADRDHVQFEYVIRNNHDRTGFIRLLRAVTDEMERGYDGE